MCVHVQAGSHICFAVLVLTLQLQRWNVLSLCVSTYIHVCASACLIGADACCGWALRRCPVVIHLEKCQEAQRAAWHFEPQAKMKEMNFFLSDLILRSEFINTKECVCLSVPCTLSPVGCAQWVTVHSFSAAYIFMSYRVEVYMCLQARVEADVIQCVWCVFFV